MKKKLLALAVAVAMAAAVGCGATETVEGGEKSRMKFVDSFCLNEVRIYVDTETGVEYMVSYKGGAVVLVNPDGTPKIAEGYGEDDGE